MENKKYILTDEIKEVDGRILHRIKAVKDFGRAKKGNLGGWIESENNLSQKDDCWVTDNAMVFGHAWVRDKAWIGGDAKVYEYAEVYGYAHIFGDASIYGRAIVHGSTCVYGCARVNGDAHVFGDANIYGDAKVESSKDYAVYKNSWSSTRYFTWTRSNNMWKVGCFHGTGEELIKKAYEDSEISGKCYEAIVRAQEIISNVN